MIECAGQNIERGDGRSDAPARILKGGMGSCNVSARILKKEAMGDQMQRPKYSRGDGRSNLPVRILKRVMGDTMHQPEY